MEWASWWNGHLARYNSQTGCPNLDVEADNEWQPLSNIPYATTRKIAIAL
ncbi:MULTISPECIES: hypothetical protein [Moorena]|nr:MULTISPECIES: hypothetical protein [Moorena]NER87623.1 hypothetical protein [Moorena sp. SIO3A2]